MISVILLILYWVPDIVILCCQVLSFVTFLDVALGFVLACRFLEQLNPSSVCFEALWKHVRSSFMCTASSAPPLWRYPSKNLTWWPNYYSVFPFWLVGTHISSALYMVLSWLWVISFCACIQWYSAKISKDLSADLWNSLWMYLPPPWCCVPRIRATFACHILTYVSSPHLHCNSRQ